MQVCTLANGETVVMASGKHLSPSTARSECPPLRGCAVCSSLSTKTWLLRGLLKDDLAGGQTTLFHGSRRRPLCILKARRVTQKPFGLPSSSRATKTEDNPAASRFRRRWIRVSSAPPCRWAEGMTMTTLIGNRGDDVLKRRCAKSLNRPKGGLKTLGRSLKT